jgi:hypothetical protein
MQYTTCFNEVCNSQELTSRCESVSTFRCSNNKPGKSLHFLVVNLLLTNLRSTSIWVNIMSSFLCRSIDRGIALVPSTTDPSMGSDYSTYLYIQGEGQLYNCFTLDTGKDVDIFTVMFENKINILQQFYL